MNKKERRTGTVRRGRTLLSLLLALALIFGTALPGVAAFAAEDDGLTTLTKSLRGADGNKYTVTASFGAETGIPAGAALAVASIGQNDASFDSYVSQAEQELHCSIDRETEIQLFDISIVSGEDASVEYQPAEGTSVNMTVKLAEAPETEFGVVHFGEETERLDSAVEGRTLTFDAAGFSVYAFVSVTAQDGLVHDVSAFDDSPVYLSATTKNGNTYYLSSGTSYKNTHGTVINRTAANTTEGAVAYTFEPLAGTDNQFYMYLAGENDTRQYVKLTKNTNAEYVTSAADATALTIAPCGEAFPNTFSLSFVQGGITYYLNLRKDEGGSGFNGSDYKPGTSTASGDKESVGSILTAYSFLPSDTDQLELDGLTYGIAWPKTDNTASAVTATANNASTLVAHNVPTRANPLNNGEDVMIHAGSDIDMFTFRLCGDNEYYITTVVGGATKYLRIASGGAVTFVDTPDEYCAIRITAGTGNYAGKLRFTGKKSGYSLSINSTGTIVSARNSNNVTEYFMLAEKTNLGDDDFVSYTAIKTTISKDKNGVYPIKNGMSIIVYTRIWNETAKQYEFYAIDHDGSLKRVYDEGDTIRWAGAQINTLLWKFTEYYYWPYFLQIPNYYYELQNVYSGKYIAPQVHTGQILSNRTIGINLNGRRYGEYYSTILAWDDYRYDYAGLKTADDNSAVVSVPMSKAQDFYFAIMDDPVPEEFSTVETVDNAEYGIKMRLINFQGEKYDGGGRDRSQTDVMGAGTEVFEGGKTPLLGLVSTDLNEDGYPVATRTDKSLEELFGAATDVNHLFLKSTYGESGYFEYDCTQTFATLTENGNFRVYNQIGTVETSTNSQGHGWFMPYNDIDPDVISAYTNVTDVHNQPLSSNDPRLGEQLYSIPKAEAQYHFGMEMEASFIQSKSGLDAWGHDIIFEFAGDDDMWLYVDGELVLDLGGVHSALVGKINFRTGDVTIPDPSNGTASHTTLRALFEQNYRKRNPNATNDEVTAHLDHYFNEGTSVFKDYTSHTMKMYYMERGAGASNLHMRFNLTTATDGQLLLSKKVSGTDKQDYTSARFAYQIHYFDKNYDAFRTVHRTTVNDGGNTFFEYSGVTYVNYEGKKEPVEYAESYEGYNDVFFLKPGETAEIQFPDDETLYYITECHVDTRIYDEVTANDIALEATGDGDFKDFSTWQEQIGQRKVVNYDNHVSPDALRMLSITKNLYDEKGNQLHYDLNDPDNDDTGFRFRVYIGEDENGEPTYYRMDSYYVRDPAGNYCRYDYEAQRFSSLGKTVFEQLTEEDLDICTFTTSPSGAIDKIPNDFTVEIRNLLVDTKFYIEERESDIPKGYNLVGYDRVDGSYLVEDGDTVNSGIVRDNASPQIIVMNHRGWGITVEKVWTDDSFMNSHDNIYFAVYLDRNGTETLVPGTVRRMRTEVNGPNDEAETSIYYYFEELETGLEFSDYKIREVVLTGSDLQVDIDGCVTGYDSVTPVPDGGTLTNGGVPTQTGAHGTFTYTAAYATGTPEGPARNVRTDTVTNARPGVRILKVDGNGSPLADAGFTLTGGSGAGAISQTYISNSAGLVTFAYPELDVTYTLTETDTPDGYSAIIDSITFTLGTDGLAVSGTESGAVTVSGPDADGTITITVKNYRSTIKAVKVDSSNANRYVEGAHFALYRQVMGKNGPMRDYYPLIGYEDLVSDANGVIPGINGSLPAGTYYLSETQAPQGYYLLDHDILFTLDDTDNITILSSADDGCTFTRVLNEHNEQICTLLIPNRRTMKSITLTPQTLVADFGLDICYNVKDNNYLVTKDSAYSYIGVCSNEYYDELGAEEAPELLAAVGTAYKGKYGTVTLGSDGAAEYKIDTMAFTGEDEFCLVAQVTKIAGEAVTGVYVYEMLTYIPATTVYYEDDFIADSQYHDGVDSGSPYQFGKWSRVNAANAKPTTLQAADLASHSEANIFGYDPNYTEFASYSNDSAHVVSVGETNGGNSNKNWPYVEFDFAGTGFDLVSVTGCDTGVFAVRVYKTTANTDGSVTVGKRVKNVMVDTYYGYDYGALYLDADHNVTLTPSDTPLYAATDEIVDAGLPSNVLKASGKFLTPTVTFYDTEEKPTETPYYRDASGKITATEYYVNTADATDVRREIPRDTAAEYVPNYAYARAEGWILSGSADQSLYQIPVIKIRDLEYGTYRAQIEPRFTTNYGHYQTKGDYKYFDLYVDAIRVYDPAGSGNDGTLTSTVIQEAYNYSSEAYETFTTLKNVIVGAETMGAGSDEQEGLVVVDGGVALNTDRLNDYVQFGPNSELYLSKGMSIAFQIRASEVPADVQIQLKKISDAYPKLKVTYLGKNGKVFQNEVEIRSATDLSYSILNMIGRDNLNWSKKNGVTSSGTVIISNTGADESLISVTNLKWTFTKPGSGYSVVNKEGRVVVDNSSVSGAKKALAFSRKNTAVSAAGDPAYENGAVTVTVSTAADVDSLEVRDADGNVIDENLLDITFSDIDDTERQWTVTLLENEDDDYTFFVSAASDGLVSGEALALTVRVENALPEEQEETTPGDDTGADEEPQTSGFRRVFDWIRSALLRLVDLLRRLLAIFGISF